MKMLEEYLKSPGLTPDQIDTVRFQLQLERDMEQLDPLLRRRQGPEESSHGKALAVVAATGLVLLALTQATVAVPAIPKPVVLTQPDGAQVEVQVRGDEFFNWFEDSDGYTIVRDANNRLVYAELDKDQRLSPTTKEVGKVDPQAVGLQKGVLPPPAVRAIIRADRGIISRLSPRGYPLPSHFSWWQ